RFRIRPETVEESREKVRAAFDMIETEAGPSGYLVGESFTVADLTAASILAPIVMPPEFPYIELHPDERTAQSRRFRDSLKDRPGRLQVDEEQPPTRARPRLLLRDREQHQSEGVRSFHGVR